MKYAIGFALVLLAVVGIQTAQVHVATRTVETQGVEFWPFPPKPPVCPGKDDCLPACDWEGPVPIEMCQAVIVVGGKCRCVM